MNKGIGLSALAIASLLCFTSVNANEIDNKFYVGASAVISSDYRTDHPSRFNVGYQFHPNFAVELAQIDFGEVDTSDNIDVDGYSASLIAKYPLGNFNLYGKLGAFSWSEEGLSVDPYGMPPIVTSIDNSGTDVLFGGGVSYHFNEHIALKAEIVRSEFNHFGFGIDIYF
ncbi:MAG: outer membrane beta-barrel protein [Psychrobium sp.]